MLAVLAMLGFARYAREACASLRAAARGRGAQSGAASLDTLSARGREGFAPRAGQAKEAPS